MKKNYEQNVPLKQKAHHYLKINQKARLMMKIVCIENLESPSVKKLNVRRSSITDGVSWCLWPKHHTPVRKGNDRFGLANAATLAS